MVNSFQLCELRGAISRGRKTIKRDWFRGNAAHVPRHEADGTLAPFQEVFVAALVRAPCRLPAYGLAVYELRLLLARHG